MKRAPEPKSLRAALKAAAKTMKTPASKQAAPKQTGAPHDTDDALLWRHIASGVKPLQERAKKRLPIVPTSPALATSSTATSAEKPRLGAVGIGHNAPARPTLTVAPALEPGIAAGIDRATFQKLRSGQMPIDGTLDLHGMTQAEAHDALIRYIGNSYRAGRRCLIVITGKGRRSEVQHENFPSRSRGVLQRVVPEWLNQLDLRPMVLAIAHAQPKHGGTGALYVLLRRKRG